MQNILSHWLLQISRPYLWTYTIVPYVLGVIYALPIDPLTLYRMDWTMPIIIGFLFLYPINLLQYGINDLHDRDTDSINPQKIYTPSHRAILQQPVLLQAIIWGVNLLYALLLIIVAPNSILVLFMIYVLIALYSYPPMRLKARNIADVVTGFSLILPAYIGGTVVTGEIYFPDMLLLMIGVFLGGALRLMASVPDIRPDTDAGIETTAVILGKDVSMLLCGAFHLIAALLGLAAAPWYLCILWVIGSWTIIGMAWSQDSDEKMEFYVRLMPWFFALMGVLLGTIVVMAKY